VSATQLIFSLARVFNRSPRDTSGWFTSGTKATTIASKTNIERSVRKALSGSKKNGGGSMIEFASNNSSVSTESVLGSLQMPLDCAIVEGSEPHLRVFVAALRTANLELAKAARRKLTMGSNTLCAAYDRVAS
jgi:hypothetical protein